MPVALPLEVRMAQAYLKHLMPHFTGTLDGATFKKVSTESSGKRFVIKGFMDSKGPAVRLSCKWGEFEQGFAWYIAGSDHDWEDVEERISHKVEGLRFVIKNDFTASDGKHVAVFTGNAKA